MHSCSLSVFRLITALRFEIYRGANIYTNRVKFLNCPICTICETARWAAMLYSSRISKRRHLTPPKARQTNAGRRIFDEGNIPEIG